MANLHRMFPRVKFKIFFGMIKERPDQPNTFQADGKINQWLEENPNVTIIDWKYTQAKYGDHSICIRYYEGTNLDQERGEVK